MSSVIIEVTGQLVIDHRAREWCKLPYPGHPKGCPNYGRSPECPPLAPLVEDWIDLARPHWIIVVSFNLGEFAAKMKARHTHWTDKQCRCCLYWQNTVRKQLRTAIAEFEEVHAGVISTLIPEAMGVHVFKTAAKAGITIDRHPEAIIRKVALLGYKNGATQQTLEECA